MHELCAVHANGVREPQPIPRLPSTSMMCMSSAQSTPLPTPKAASTQPPLGRFAARRWAASLAHRDCKYKQKCGPYTPRLQAQACTRASHAKTERKHTHIQASLVQVSSPKGTRLLYSGGLLHSLWAGGHSGGLLHSGGQSRMYTARVRVAIKRHH